MSDLAHTPGPWSYFESPEGTDVNESDWNYAIGQREFSTIACVRPGNSDDFTPEENLANARLIAAAPDLLECLAHLAERDWFKEGETGQVVCGLDAAKVRAAILKATGKEAA